MKNKINNMFWKKKEIKNVKPTYEEKTDAMKMYEHLINEQYPDQTFELVGNVIFGWKKEEKVEPTLEEINNKFLEILPRDIDPESNKYYMIDGQMVMVIPIIPNKPIIKEDENGEPYYVVFKSDTIEEMKNKIKIK